MGRSKDKATFKGVGTVQLHPLFPSFWELKPLSSAPVTLKGLNFACLAAEVSTVLRTKCTMVQSFGCYSAFFNFSLRGTNIFRM